MSRATTGKRKPKLSAAPHVRRSLTDVIYVVAEHYGVSPSEVLSPSVSKMASEARSVAYALSRDVTPASLPEIGDVFCRDHSTVMTMVKRVAARCKEDMSFARSVAVCRSRCLETIRARRMVP